MCGARPGAPCKVISGDPSEGTRSGDVRAVPHFYRHNDEPIAVSVAAEPSFYYDKAGTKRWLEWSKGRYPDDSPGDVIAAYPDGTIIMDDGVTTWNPLRALDFVNRGGNLEAD
jgi:hypothetical protein